MPLSEEQYKWLAERGRYKEGTPEENQAAIAEDTRRYWARLHDQNPLADPFDERQDIVGANYEHMLKRRNREDAPRAYTEALKRAIAQVQAQSQHDRGQVSRKEKMLSGRYADQSGRERNYAAMYKAQQQFMRNNPHMAPGYWDGGGMRQVEVTPLQVTPAQITPLWR
jgi:hypothetical protein